MGGKEVAEVLIVLKLRRDERLWNAWQSARTVADCSLSESSSCAMVNEIAHGRIEAKSTSKNTAEVSAQRRIASPSSADHSLGYELLRHLTSNHSSYGYLVCPAG
jgi:hypothetical protein